MEGKHSKRHFHGNVARQVMRRNLTIGGITCALAFLVVRILTWNFLQLSGSQWLWLMRIILIAAIIAGLIGSVFLIVGFLQWMRQHSGI